MRSAGSWPKSALFSSKVIASPASLPAYRMRVPEIGRRDAGGTLESGGTVAERASVWPLLRRRERMQQAAPARLLARGVDGVSASLAVRVGPGGFAVERAAEDHG